jgi:hypothetical protein
LTIAAEASLVILLGPTVPLNRLNRCREPFAASSANWLSGSALLSISAREPGCPGAPFLNRSSNAMSKASSDRIGQSDPALLAECKGEAVGRRERAGGRLPPQAPTAL